MIRPHEINSFASKLRVSLLDKYLEEDVSRSRNNYYGIKRLPRNIDEPIVFVGARSGFEIIRILYDYDHVRICVVEGNDIIKDELVSVLRGCEGLSWSERVTFCRSLTSLDECGIGEIIGLIRVDIEKFYWEDLLEILNKYTVKHICGEFDPVYVDPMEVYRVSRDNANSFNWRVIGSAIPLVRREQKSLYEVSVVITAYKALPWIDRCLDSLVHQTLDSIEIIAVDDGSPDDTGKRLDEWASKYPEKIRVIHKQNEGCASARNCGLYEARGEYVTFVDADNWFDERMFADLYRSVIMNGTDVAECGYAEYSENKGNITKYPSISMEDDHASFDEAENDPILHLGKKPTIGRRIYRKEFLIGNSIFFSEDIRYFADLSFQFEVLSKVSRMSLIQKCYYFYRQEADEQDEMMRDQRLFLNFKIFNRLHERVGKLCDAKVDRYILRCKLSRHGWALSRIESKYKLAYLRSAINDIINHNGSIDKIEIYTTIVKKRGLIILAIMLFISLFGSGRIPEDN